MGDDASQRPPDPLKLFVHDDLTDEVRELHGEGSEELGLTRKLFDLIRLEAPRVTVLTVDEQIARLIERDRHDPFALTLGIGAAGERVARQVHDETGWFPSVRRVDVTREEDGSGGYRLVSTTEEALEVQLQGLEGVPSLALVDDTVFSGLTMGTVLRALQPAVLSRTHAFCLRCVSDSLLKLETLCPVSAGFAAEGRILEDVSFINASGLVRRVGIRRRGKPPLAFFDRPEWIRAWFPLRADEIITTCTELNLLLDDV